LQDVQVEEFQAIPSTYWPFGLALGVAFAGCTAYLLLGSQGALAIAAIFNALGFLGMLAETNLDPNWTRWLLPRTRSQNVVGKIQAASNSRSNVVLCAHLDTHRTPVFFSSVKWLALFSTLIGLAALSMGVGAGLYGAACFMGWSWARWLGFILIPIQGFALTMVLHADFTPFSPGANDNASGVAVVLDLLSRLLESPLSTIDVHYAFTDCEEAGAWGMANYLDRHAAELGKDTFYIILDQVGAGRIKFLSSDGLLVKHKTHPRAMEVAKQVASMHPELQANQVVGIAYTDALHATKRGLVALTLCTIPDGEGESGMNWHQMSDTLDAIVIEDLERTAEYTWQILQLLDAPNEQ
jgi:hypothetical protein